MFEVENVSISDDIEFALRFELAGFFHFRLTAVMLEILESHRLSADWGGGQKQQDEKQST